MATQTTVILTDSLDERIKSGVETVTFYDPATGTKREIELGEANRKHFANHLEKLAKYIEASRMVESAPKKVAKTQGNSDLAKIREWAKKNGYQVGDRGRIKAEIADAYYAAQDSKIEVKPAEPEVSIGWDVDSEGKPVEGSQEVAKGTDEAWQGDGPSDADILAMMAEIEATEGEVTLESLKGALDSNPDEQ